MDRSRDPLRRARRLFLASALGIAVLGAGPWAVAAADETPVPEATSTPTAEPTATPTPEPTATPTPTPDPTPTAAPTPTPTPAPTATPSPTPTPAPIPTPGSTQVLTSINLYRSGAMVRQYTNYWCVPAATQSMLNLALGRSDRSYATQRAYYYKTRLHNRYRYATKGNDPEGWAYALRYYSRGRTPYYAKSYTNKAVALSAIAESIARTRDPVGVTVKNGTHAWVVLGFRSTHDPSEPSKKTILGFYVSGPLGTTADRWPYRYLKLDDFKSMFTRYHEWQRSVIWEGKWVIIAQ